MGRRNRKGKGGGGRYNKDERTANVAYENIEKHNEKFEEYYKGQNIIPDDDEFDLFYNALKEQLPTTWRFTGSKGHAITVRNSLLQTHVPHLKGQTYEGEAIPEPTPLSWYPNDLAWQLKVPKNIIRKMEPFKRLQAFLVAETTSGNISRQEAVSMIPPLLLDVEPHHTVLDMCAAPGSKTAQLIEALHATEEQLVHEAVAKLRDQTDAVTDPKKLGMPTGLVIANDSDYKRANMLIHQTKRLNSPSIIVTNNDASQYPALRLTPNKLNDGRTMTRYLRFDRVLADVPCSGDGTARKNPGIWRSWTPGNGNGLWGLQLRILVRGLQLLKVGGRLVYSTCSLNPIENESVVRAAIEKCGGTSQVDLIDVSDRLPGLKRADGLNTWRVQDKDGDWYENWEQVVEAKGDGADRIAELMFPAKQGRDEKIALERCLRIYPHLQDTGGFFVAVLEKKEQFKIRDEAGQAGGEKLKAMKAEANASAQNGAKNEETVEAKSNGGDDSHVGEPEEPKESQEQQVSTGTKRALEESTEPSAPASPTKRLKTEETPTGPPPKSRPMHQKNNADTNKSPEMEYFSFLDPNDEAIGDIFKFFNIIPHFPREDFCVRNAEGKALRTIYYTSKLSHEVLQNNQDRVVKFVHGGIKMFNKQDVKTANTCSWRVQSDGMSVVEPWIGPERRIQLTDGETLRYLLEEAFPKVEHTREMQQRLHEVNLGSLILSIDIKDSGNGVVGEEEKAAGAAEEVQKALASLKKPVGLSEKMVLPLWKNPQSVNLMIPKEERKALLLRLFNSTQEVRDSTKAMRKAKKATQAAKAEVNDTIMDDNGLEEEIDIDQIAEDMD